MLGKQQLLRWRICDMYRSSFITDEINMLAVITGGFRMLGVITGEFRMLGVITGEFHMLRCSSIFKFARPSILGSLVT